MTDDERDTYSWQWDDLHYPRPVSPLFGSIIPIYGASHGLNQMHSLYGLPVNKATRVRDGYLYDATLPFPDQKKEALERWLTVVPSLIRNLRRRWDEEQLPAIRRDIDACLAWDGEDDPVDAVLAELDRRLAMLQRHWTIHFEVVVPYGELERTLGRRYRQWLKPDDEQEVFRLFHAHESLTFMSNEALWRVGQVVRSLPAAARILQQAAPAYVLPSWRADPACLPAAKALEQFLAAYGLRASGAGFDWIDPLWSEDPTPVVAILQAQLETDWNPEQERERAQKEGERLLQDVLARLGAPERAEFLDLHAQMVQAAPLKEDHNYWIDQVSTVGTMRLFFLALGRRLVRAGVFDRPDDIFYLYEAEVRESLASPADRRDLVGARRDEHRRQGERRPPHRFGPIAPGYRDDFRGEERDDPGPQATQIQGYGACKGTVTGTARVVAGPHEFGKVGRGEILVCPTTTPAWTALFGTVAAVVTDAGGILSHAAMVAREYGLPAVVGTKYATQRIRDGQRITVNGETGVVYVETEP